ncbi:hypothetical protein ACWGIN_10345 [Streptomyces sp. NPDC054861]
MRGDETGSAQSATAAGDATLARRGPRHAAPRKSLLNKIQGPAGKAMALAAMPTAVLMGMGMAPKLALADEKDIPFAPGPCVTRSDEPVDEESKKPSEKPEPTPSASQTPAPDATSGPEAGEEQEKPAPDTGTPADDAPKTGTAGTGPAKTGAEQDAAAPQQPAPAPTPTPTKSVNPLDPLGLGDKIKDFFDGPDATPTGTPSPTATTPAEKPTTAPTTAPATPPKKDTAPEPDAPDAPDAPVDKTKDAIKEAADKAGAEVKELPEDAKGLDAKKDEDIPDGAKPRFPCPEADPEALAAAELEPGIPLLPDEPWKLNSTMLTLKGLKYHGIVEVKTGSGKIKKVLKFTASDGVDIKDLHQRTVHSEGHTGHVRSDKGSTSTIRNGTVTMYTEQLKGNLFGLIPITFNPQSPPPLDVPFAFFTGVEVIQAGQFGGTLKVPGLRNTIEAS